MVIVGNKLEFREVRGMASSKEYLDFILEQLSLSWKKYRIEQ